MEISEYLWRMYNEHRTQQRHHETQRGAVTTVTLALAGAVVAFTGETSARLPAWPLAVFLIVLGLFGATFSLKQAERAQLNASIALVYRRRLEQELETSDFTAEMLNSLDVDARKAHRQKWNWRTGRVEMGSERGPLFRLYWFFVALNMLIVTAGVVILVLTLIG